MYCGGSHDLHLRACYYFWRGDKPRAVLEEGRLVSLPPTNLEVHDTDAVATLAQSLEEMVALVGAAFDPVRLLKDKNSHAAVHHTRYPREHSKVFISPSSMRGDRESPGDWRPWDNRPSLGECARGRWSRGLGLRPRSRPFATILAMRCRRVSPNRTRH